MSRFQITADHWLTEGTACRHHPSPNFNVRPADTNISLLVIHNISLPAGVFGGPYVEQLFTNCLDCQIHSSFSDLEDVKVSSHLFIEREAAISQFVPFNLRAWHAGVSIFDGIDNCNDYSIGIELEGSDDIEYTESQYQCLSELTKIIMVAYPEITLDRIVGHSDIAPGRKTDPGPAFNWAYFHQLLESK